MIYEVEINTKGEKNEKEENFFVAINLYIVHATSI